MQVKSGIQDMLTSGMPFLSFFSEETHEILKEGNNASDKTIKEVICRETHDYFVKLETCERSGRAEMAKCTCNKRGPAADI